jgi:hypothetical protein
VSFGGFFGESSDNRDVLNQVLGQTVSLEPDPVQSRFLRLGPQV